MGSRSPNPRLIFLLAKRRTKVKEAVGRLKVFLMHSVGILRERVLHLGRRR